MKRMMLFLGLFLISLQSVGQGQDSILLDNYNAKQQVATAENQQPIKLDQLKNTNSAEKQVNKSDPQRVEKPIIHQEMPLIKMLLFAFLGGLTLNLMPCVFPILSIKVLTIKSYGNRRSQGIFYMLGVLFTFLLIALIIIVLESLGRSVGWGFQMQSPVFVIALIFLFTLIALNLFGFYDIPFTLNSSHKWRARHKLMYSFMSGILASVVTTPCSAPFMATALGFAISSGYLNSLLIFLTLGFGFALPFLFFCWLPNSSAILPKPGMWMEKIKQFLGFPILLTVIWLLWVAGYQMNIDSVMMILVSLCFMQFSMWLWKSIKNKPIRIVTVLLSLYLIVYPLYWIHQNITHELHDTVVEEFSPEKLNTLLSQHRKVFVYATATWCITCKMNEKIALETKPVRDFFQKNKIIVMKADWTNRNNEILTYLKSFNREGIPLYVYYSDKNITTVLPQLLTPSLVIDNISQHINSK